MKKTNIVIGKVALYVNPSAETVKVGSKGKATPVGKYFASLPKSESRKLRQALRNAGYPGLAGAARIAA